MIRVKKIPFQTNKESLSRFCHCNRISAQVYNDCLKISKAYSKDNGKWINKTQLQQATKRKYPLHSQSIQAVCHKYLDARNAAREARNKGYKNRYPYKQKKYFTTKWAKDGFYIDYEKRKITFSMGVKDGKRQKPISVKVDKLPSGKIKEIELVYSGKLHLAISYEDGHDPIVKLLQQSIWERFIKRLRNKKHSQIRKKLSRTKKGSRRYRKLRRAMQMRSKLLLLAMLREYNATLLLAKKQIPTKKGADVKSVKNSANGLLAFFSLTLHTN